MSSKIVERIKLGLSILVPITWEAQTASQTIIIGELKNMCFNPTYFQDTYSHLGTYSCSGINKQTNQKLTLGMLVN